ncbi:hypothetical protein EHS25_002784 [Saitozyma podzolica]|uniref:RTA1-domain-containing protein n=1 Tax=Saitozyma podzolica TaxID=1890683 RepID=A0A427YDE8_9TREE|nr:hypothetical protein EHS25_002784 [Saitozyma podzolica]
MATSGRLITGYVPKAGLTYTGLVCFGLLALVFWFRKKWMLCLCIGMSCMAAGFAARIPMTNNPGSLGIYIAQTMFILLSPCAFLAQNYIILPRLATWLDSEDCLFLPSRIIVRLFVWSDVITFWLQGGGGGLTAAQNSTMANIGYYVSLAGLIAQFASYATFTALLITFALRVRSRYPSKWSGNASTDYYGAPLRRRMFEDWRTLFFAILWTCVGIFVRSIYRIIEYAQGYNGTLRTTEVYFYVLDSLPLFLAMAVWTVIWPPSFISGPAMTTERPSSQTVHLTQRQVEAGDIAMTQTNSKGWP